MLLSTGNMYEVFLDRFYAGFCKTLRKRSDLSSWKGHLPGFGKPEDLAFSKSEEENQFLKANKFSFECPIFYYRKPLSLKTASYRFLCDNKPP